jgi:hypothetical protein
MLRWRAVFASALTAVAVLAVAPGTASAAPEDQISITGAEIALHIGSSQHLNVVGTGVCASAGSVVLTVNMTDLDTGATASSASSTQCTSPSEHIGWIATVFNSAVNEFRPGDRVNITVTATGAITDTDAKTTRLQQFH